jgi:hypothetical protein
MITETVLLALGTFVMSVMRCAPTGSGLFEIGQLPIGVPLSLHESHFGTVMSVRKPLSVFPYGIAVGPCVAVAVAVFTAVAVAVAVTVAVGAVSVAVAVVATVVDGGAVAVGVALVVAVATIAALKELRAAPNGPFALVGAVDGPVAVDAVFWDGCDGGTTSK